MFPQNGARITDFDAARSSGDVTIGSVGQSQGPAGVVSREDYAALPDELTLREVKVGHQDSRHQLFVSAQVCKRALGAALSAALARRAGSASDLKTTLQMAECVRDLLP